MNLEDLGFTSNLPGRGVHIVSTYQGCGAGVPCAGLGRTRPIRSGQFMGSLGLAGLGRSPNVPDLVALQVAGLGATASASGSASGSGSTDWAAIIAAATTGASKIIDSAKSDEAAAPQQAASYYQPAYTPPPPAPAPARSSTDLSSVLPFAALVVGGVLGALVARAI